VISIATDEDMVEVGPGLHRPTGDLWAQLSTEGVNEVAKYRRAYRQAARQCGVGIRSAKLTFDRSAQTSADKLAYDALVEVLWANRDQLHNRALRELKLSNDPLVQWTTTWAAHRLDWAIVAMSKSGNRLFNVDAFARARSWCEDWQILSAMAWNAGVIGLPADCGSCQTESFDGALQRTCEGEAVCPTCYPEHRAVYGHGCTCADD
jgi:hypothetical protein